MRARRAAAAAAAAASVVTALVVIAGPSAASDSDLDRVKSATARYHDVRKAVADGFGELKDGAGIACIDKQGAGGMGIHYVLGSRVGDPAIRASEPELVIYRPGKDGKLTLVAVEYVVLADAWAEAGNTKAPSLFGQTFTLVGAPNRYDLPPFFELHAWVWDRNDSGTFADYNPAVRCPTA